MKTTAQAHLELLTQRFPELLPASAAIHAATEALCSSSRSGGTVLVCGNGGSAADAEHIVGELMKGFILPRALPAHDVARFVELAGAEEGAALAAHLQQGVRAIALTGHPALSTAVLNDTDPYCLFAQQVNVHGRPGDVLLGISTSGNARNVVNALITARARGLTTIGLTGPNPSKMSGWCDILINVPGASTMFIQELMLPIYHAICLAVEEELFGE